MDGSCVGLAVLGLSVIKYFSTKVSSCVSISELVAYWSTVVLLPVIIHCRISGGCLLILHSLHDLYPLVTVSLL